MKAMKELAIEPVLAWRNVWKNKRRTVLTLITIVVGCTMIIFMNAIATGSHEQMIEDSVKTNTSHIQVHEKGFWENRSIEYAFIPEPAMLGKLARDKRVIAVSRRIEAGGLISYKNASSGAIIQAIEPDFEIKVSDIYKTVLHGGRFLQKGDRNSAVMGEVLAKNLGVKVGETVSMISQGFDGSIAAENLTVVGLVNTGNPEYDRNLLMMPFDLATDTFTMMGYISSLAVRLRSSGSMEEVRNYLRDMVDVKKIEVMGWDELMPELVQFIVMDDVSGYIFDFILLMIVAFGILNTIQMSVYERIREFGVMLAIGTRPGQVTAMILFESAFISLMGVFLGLIAGSALSYYFTLHPLDYSQYAEEMKVWGMSTVLFPARITWLNLFLTSTLVFTLAVIFSYFPARRAARLKPIEAIRHL